MLIKRKGLIQKCKIYIYFFGCVNEDYGKTKNPRISARVVS